MADDYKGLKLEKQILFTSTVFLFSLFAVATLTIDLFGIGLPTCVTDVKPFKKSEVIYKTPTHYEIHWVAGMWKFEPSEISIPAGTDVDIYLSSIDVTHGFQITGTNVNLLAVPGVVNYAHTKLKDPGDYWVTCHEYCGTGHQNMSAVIHVTNPIQAPIPFPTASGEANLAEAGHPGLRVMQDRGCLACHTTSGQPGMGPTFKGLFNSMVELSNGSKVKADEAYIKDCVRHPRTDVKGFNPVMPTIPVTDEELSHIVDYIKTLK